MNYMGGNVPDKKKRKTITITVDDFEYEEIQMYARAKGHGGKPASALAHYAVFSYMKKYPLSEAEKRKYYKDTKKALMALKLYSRGLWKPIQPVGRN